MPTTKHDCSGVVALHAPCLNAGLPIFRCVQGRLQHTQRRRAVPHDLPAPARHRTHSSSDWTQCRAAEVFLTIRERWEET